MAPPPRLTSTHSPRARRDLRAIQANTCTDRPTVLVFHHSPHDPDQRQYQLLDHRHFHAQTQVFAIQRVTFPSADRFRETAIDATLQSCPRRPRFRMSPTDTGMPGAQLHRRRAFVFTVTGWQQQTLACADKFGKPSAACGSGVQSDRKAAIAEKWSARIAIGLSTSLCMSCSRPYD